MQTIIGAGGAIGIPLAQALQTYTSDIRLVGRNPKKVNPTDQLHPADITHRDEVMNAVAGSEIVYVTVGFEYKLSVWQQTWPPFITNVINACIQHGAKLVFFDNVYAVDPNHINPLRETSPINPISQKGKVRAEVNRLILDAVERKQLQAIIARAPDFFGPIKDKSFLMNMVYDNLKKGKGAQWFCNAQAIHTTGYTPDLAKGTAILGNTPDAYNQIWNLPVDPTPITTEQWVQLFAKEMGGKTGVMNLAPWMIKVFGWMNPLVGEIYEMLYQYDRDYYFDSSKFNNRFNYTPTPNAQAVKETVQAFG